jgi:hypothetical protein
MAKYRRTFTSGDKLTSTANQVIDFKIDDNTNVDVEYLNFQTFATPCHIKLNDEETVHWIDANSELTFTDMYIDKITIIDAEIQFYYTALAVD